MSGLNWSGFIMLFLALIFNEMFLGINTWYDMNAGAVIAAVTYLLVGATLSVWPSRYDEEEEA